MRRRFLNDKLKSISNDYELQYFTIEALEDGLTVKLSRNTSYYSIDDGVSWSSLSANTETPTINNEQKILFKIDNPTISSSYGMGTFTISKQHNVSGNIMSLLYGDNFEGQTDLTGKNYVFYKLFNNCSNIIDASNLILPAIILASNCYYSMFLGCTSLTATPKLPATLLTTTCYYSMFSGCTSLTTAPELPSTNLAISCYLGMFNGCTSLLVAPKLPAMKLLLLCYKNMFSGCTSLTTAPELPSTNLAISCYESMFSGCTSLTAAPELPATSFCDLCYGYMFSNTNVLPDCSNIDFTSERVISSCGLRGLFARTKVTDTDLMKILPLNNERKYCLPVTKLTSYCYSSMFEECTSLTTAPELPATTLEQYCYKKMFSGCTSLTTAPELPATILKYYCYDSMFYNCTALTTAPELPATTLASGCYDSMFYNCTALTTAPELPATTLASGCYEYMFYGCSKLNNITMLATDISASSCLYSWVYRVASSGTFVKHINMTTLPSGANGIPIGWTVNDNITLLDCISLEIIADDVNGRRTNTTIYYTAQINALDGNGNQLVITKTGTAISEEFPQNTSETESIDRTITFTYMGVTATTIITQGIWTNQSYSIMLNNQWQLSNKPNPNASLYDGVYESFSNKGVNSKAAIMYIDIDGYTNFNLYIRSYAESNYDYVMVSQLDQSITNNTSYNDTTLVKAHTRGNQKSGTDISNYTHVQFTNIDGGEHRITIVYRKDSSTASGDDKGYVLIEKA